MNSLIFSADFFEDRDGSLKLFRFNSEVVLPIGYELPSNAFDNVFNTIRDGMPDRIILFSKDSQDNIRNSFLKTAGDYNDLRIESVVKPNDSNFFIYREKNESDFLIRTCYNGHSKFDNLLCKDILNLHQSIELKKQNKLNIVSGNSILKNKKYIKLHKTDKSVFKVCDSTEILSEGEFLIENYTKSDNKHHSIISSLFFLNETLILNEIAAYRLLGNPLSVEKNINDVYIDPSTEYTVTDVSHQHKYETFSIVENILNNILKK